MSGICGQTMLAGSGLSLAWLDHPQPARGTIGDLVRAAAAASPEAVALTGVAGSLTYSDLIRRAAQVHAALAARGARRGDLIAVLAGRELDLPALLLGILDSGCGYVPLAPHYPMAFIDSVLSVAQPALILTGRHMSARVGTTWRDRLICTEEITDEAASPPPTGTASDAAYVIFTSGSTGRPKGVIVRHSNVTRLMVSPSYATITRQSVALALSPPSFDAAVFDLWPFLAAGARVVLHPDEPPTPESIATLVRHHGVNTAFVTTGLFNRVAEDRPDAFDGVEVLTGGERGSAEDARRVLAAGAPAVVHCYGPTEATVFTTAARFSGSAPPREPFAIGGPVAGTACYVLDADRRPLPIGTDGELWIGGEAVASGYLGDAELTAARFLPDPFRPEGRMYRSGDSVRMQSDGSLIFLDRLDEQLKIRGHRVEPAAIARRLEAAAGVRRALVLAAEVGPGDRRLCAFIEAAAAPAGFESALRSELGEELPAALVPWRIVTVPSFPLSANGKIDREALLARLAVAPAPAFGEPQYAAIATLFTSILNLAPNSADDDFFDLGGDSLLATRLLGRLREQFGWHGTLRDLYSDATIRGIAQRLSGEMAMFEAGSL